VTAAGLFTYANSTSEEGTFPPAAGWDGISRTVPPVARAGWVVFSVQARRTSQREKEVGFSKPVGLHTRIHTTRHDMSTDDDERGRPHDARQPGPRTVYSPSCMTRNRDPTECRAGAVHDARSPHFPLFVWSIYNERQPRGGGVCDRDAPHVVTLFRPFSLSSCARVA
jgi:hypothetical protein